MRVTTVQISLGLSGELSIHRSGSYPTRSFTSSFTSVVERQSSGQGMLYTLFQPYILLMKATSQLQHSDQLGSTEFIFAPKTWGKHLTDSACLNQ